MRHLWVILLSFAVILVIVAILRYNPQPQPFQTSEDMAFPANYIKKAAVEQKDVLAHILYSDSTKELLDTTRADELQGFRCSDSIIRLVDGVYLLEYVKTETRAKRRIKNDDFLRFMRSKEPNLPIGKKILTSRVCELENNAILLFYSIGEYDAFTNETNPKTPILHSTNNEAFIQVFPTSPFAKQQSFQIATSQDHIVCDEPFELHNDNLFLLCKEHKEWNKVYTTIKVNLKNGKFEVINTCENKYENQLETRCN